MAEFEVRFIRHAKGNHMINRALIAGRSMDAELTEEGKIEASRKGHQLAIAGVVPDRVVSSPARRCIQTSRYILDAMGITQEITVASDLIEMDQGDYVGRVRKEVYNPEVQQEILLKGKDFALPGGESMNQVGQRGLNWLHRQEMPSSLKKLTLFAISHAGLITHTVGAIEGWDQPTSLKRLQSMPTVSETILVFDGNEWHLQAFAKPLRTK